MLREAAETLERSGSETPRLDAELLLGHVVSAGRTTLLAAPEAAVSDGQSERFRELVERRARGEPVAYIRGIKEFYGIALSVDARALIPRPETELLVDLGLERIKHLLIDEPRPSDSAALLVWDMGTGSGAICVALAVECRRRGYGADVRFRATDSSADALALAVENAVGHGVADQIDFALADLTSGQTPGDNPAMADLIVANLPYIPSDVVPTLPVAASFEPVAALDGGAGGLTVIERLLTELPDALAERGEALLEIGADQGASIEAAVTRTLPDWRVEIRNDLAGRPRVAIISRPA
ncbi:MAG TPA: peptide chain release factor N(5)-glutamine methyltransferase [Candidatus Limnocylindrales bacterium]|nr:peptide chain release factor N(5)-glutamine methyltransferase [Candidatus Limnocylindrales bacterium]